MDYPLLPTKWVDASTLLLCTEKSTTVNPLNVASKNVGKFAPELYWHPFNLANSSQKSFEVYINVKSYTCLKYVRLHLMWKMCQNWPFSRIEWIANICMFTVVIHWAKVLESQTGELLSNMRGSKQEQIAGTWLMEYLWVVIRAKTINQLDKESPVDAICVDTIKGQESLDLI